MVSVVAKVQIAKDLAGDDISFNAELCRKVRTPGLPWAEWKTVEVFATGTVDADALIGYALRREEIRGEYRLVIRKEDGTPINDVLRKVA